VKPLSLFALSVLLISCTGTQQKAAIDNTVVASTVKAKLIGIDADAATAVKVTAANGAVTLTGQARDEAERAQYQAAAHAVDGVVSVLNDIVVNPHLRGLREGAGDAALTARVSATIAGQAGINVFNLRVSSRAGIVSISGHVPSASIERTVVETARATPGVKRVISEIQIGK
jgi:osmotically-inducible protein OsmY